MNLERLNYVGEQRFIQLKEVEYTANPLQCHQERFESSDLVLNDEQPTASLKPKSANSPPLSSNSSASKRIRTQWGQYQLLLEKRAEAGILKASNLLNTKVMTLLWTAINRQQVPIVF